MIGRNYTQERKSGPKIKRLASVFWTGPAVFRHLLFYSYLEVPSKEMEEEIPRDQIIAHIVEVRAV